MNSSVGDTLPRCRDSTGGRRNLEHNDPLSFYKLFVDTLEGYLVIGLS